MVTLQRKANDLSSKVSSKKTYGKQDSMFLTDAHIDETDKSDFYTNRYNNDDRNNFQGGIDEPPLEIILPLDKRMQMDKN